MLEMLKNTMNRTRTENGAVTHLTAGSDCLDLFAAIGAMRGAEDRRILDSFHRAWAEDPDLAMKLLFYARDVRGGLGERRIFRVILKDMAVREPASVRKNIAYIAEYGRYDDLLCLLGTPCEADAVHVIRTQLDEDLRALEAPDGGVSLLAKWLPSVNASNGETVRAAKHLARALGMTDAAYRKTLSVLRERIRLIENNLRERDYTFDYEKQPSRALYKYRAAFQRNDGERYAAFLDRVEAGQATMHTGALAPYDIVRPFFNRTLSLETRRAADVTWNALEDFTGGENALVVADGSGSMYGGGEPLPISVALSLAIYFAERNTGAFHNHFITFSGNPRLVEIKGKDIFEKVDYCHRYEEVANTNIQRVFERILEAAVKNRVPQKDMPAALYIISDMEFDCCADGAGLTNFQYAKALYARHGYALPRVVFWNVANRHRQQPVTKNEQGVVLVSGSGARVFGMLKSGALDPYAFMLEVLGAERYRPIAA